jgi:hypothetical protein
MTTQPLDIGRRRCRDCGLALPPAVMYRCASCLLRRIDRIRSNPQNTTERKS